MAPAQADATVVFVGPSLPAAEVRALAPDAMLAPPVAAFDVLRLLRRRPPARLVIIDGYFERMAAVWHKELVLALEAGVEVGRRQHVGALRAAELDRFGMRGVGAIYRDYRQGRLTRDADVAVAHLPAEGGYLALTVAQVNVRAAVAAARAAGVVPAATARAVVAASAGLRYWERTWDDVDALVPVAHRAGFVAWRRAAAPDQKADDARALLRAVAASTPQRRPGAAVPRTWALAQMQAVAAAPRSRRR
ncbi:MAG: TfuA-like protein [Kofleriaceae bacterium]